MILTGRHDDLVISIGKLVGPVLDSRFPVDVPDEHVHVIGGAHAEFLEWLDGRRRCNAVCNLQIWQFSSLIANRAPLSDHLSKNDSSHAPDVKP